MASSIGCCRAAVTLAQIGPFTGPAANDAGMHACLADANAKGGVGGRRLELVTLDDRYDRAEFSRRLAEAQTQGAVGLLSSLGINVLRALLEDLLLERSDMVVVNALPDNLAALASLARSIDSSDSQAVVVIGSPPRMAEPVAVLRKAGSPQWRARKRRMAVEGLGRVQGVVRSQALAATLRRSARWT